MALQLPRSRFNVRSIEAPQRRIPLEQILAIEGQNPLAQGIETTGNVLGNAILKRAELRRQGEQLAKLESLAGQQAGAFEGLDIATASTLTQLGMKQSLEGKPKPLSGTIQKDGKTYQPFYNEKDGEVSYQELLGPKQAPPKGLQFAGMTPEGQPISFDPNTGLTSTPGQKSYTGTSLPRNVGTEEQRRIALVEGAKKSIKDVKNIINSSPSVLTELKAIRLSPGRVYSQLASPEAKKLYINVREAISNEIYLKTGATANEQELENAAVSYLAALNDNPNDFIGRMELLGRNIEPFSFRKIDSPLKTMGESKDQRKARLLKEAQEFGGGK